MINNYRKLILIVTYMPKKSLIRIIQKDSKGRQKLSFPLEVGWNAGDVIKYEKIDENSVLMKRLHTS